MERINIIFKNLSKQTQRGLVLVVSFLLIFNPLNLSIFITHNAEAALDQWETITPAETTGYVFNSIASVGDYVFLGTDHGIYKSADKGANWTQINQGLANLQINSIAINWNFDGAGYTFDGNTSIFLATDGGIYQGTVDQNSWTEINPGLDDLSVKKIQIDQFDFYTIYAGTDGLSESGVYRSDDQSSWSIKNSGIEGEKVKKLTSDFVLPAIYALTESNKIYSSPAYSGAMSDEAWTEVFDGGANIINDITMNESLGAYSFLATDDGVFYGDGTTWSTTGLDEGKINTIGSDFTNTSLAYAASEINGVYKTNDEGSTWTQINKNLNNLHIKDLKTNPTSPLIVYAMSSNGLYLLEYTDITEAYNGFPIAGDNIAPGKIWNLSVIDRTINSVTLAWDAPGDDGDQGVATAYDVRYSTSVITDLNWDTSAQATGEPAPGIASSSQSFTVTNLQSSTTYNFAIKTVDEIGNISLLSVMASTNTLVDDTTFPTISLVSSSTTATTSTIAWTTNEPATSQINYGTTTNYTATTTIDSNLLSSHSVLISGLNPFTTYHFRIRSKDGSENETISSDYTFKTTLTSDLNYDGRVNVVDVGILMFYWGSTARPAADINQDGIVNSIDAGIMMSQWTIN
jgi:hypothetical protein